MFVPVGQTEERGSRTASQEPASWRVRVVGPSAPYRTKCDTEPPLPLPRWTTWALVGWTVASAAAYAVVLARLWE